VFTFGRERRVRRHADYVRIQSGSERVTSRHFYFLIAPSGGSVSGTASGTRARPPGIGAARLGLIVTRKMGGAVVRNRIKRICRECFRRAASAADAGGWVPNGIDLVVVARAGAEQLGMEEALAEWTDLRGLIRKRASVALAKAANKGHVSPSAGS